MLENERIRNAHDLAEWAVAAGLHGEPRLLAERSLSVARELRLGLHELFLAVARQESPTAGQIEWLNRWIRDGRDHLRIAPGNRDGVWQWTRADAAESDDSAPALLGLVVQSAVDLLRAPDSRLLRMCANERCGWLFLDRSRKHNRRWCEMRECGGRAKARRYRSRRRAASDS